MNPTLFPPQSFRFVLATLACGLATWLHPSPSFAQSAEPAAKPEATSSDDSGRSPSTKSDAKAEPEPAPEHVYKTLEEWRKLLTYNQFLVTRMKSTEPAFSGKYAVGHPKGTFLCVCCGAKLFDSRHKFDSGTGWPSFWQPFSARAVSQALDRSEYEPRIEVMCSRCGAHLGHVFEDGPLPTGLRYCINSLSLKLDSESSSTKAATSRKTSSHGVRRRSTKTKKNSTLKSSTTSGSNSSRETGDGAS